MGNCFFIEFIPLSQDKGLNPHTERQRSQTCRALAAVLRGWHVKVQCVSLSLNCYTALETLPQYL